MSADYSPKNLAKELFTICYSELSSIKWDNIPQLNFLTKGIALPNSFLDIDIQVGGGYFYYDFLETSDEVSIDGGITILTGQSRNFSDGVIAVPSFIRSKYIVKNDYWSDFSATQSTKHVKRQRKEMLRFAEYFDSIIVPVNGSNPDNDSYLQAFDQLHNANLNKYGHRTNPWSMRVLKCLPDERFYLYFVRCRQSNKFVRALLLEWDSISATAILHVQGHAEDFDDHGLSIYRDSLIHLINVLCNEYGAKVIDFGRGAALNKAGLGANHFSVVYTLLGSSSVNYYNAFIQLQSANQLCINEELAELVQVVKLATIEI